MGAGDVTERDRRIKTCKPATFSPRNPPPVLALYLCAWCDARLDMVAKQGCLALADRGACNRDGWGRLHVSGRRQPSTPPAAERNRG